MVREAGREIMGNSEANGSWNVNVEDFFEINNVGIDAISEWKNEELDQISYYDLLGWFMVDAPFTSPALKVGKSFISKPLKFRMDFDYFRSAYWSWGGSFRYDMPV